MDAPTCYHHPHTRAQPRRRGETQGEGPTCGERGLFATAPIQRGEVLVVFTGALYRWEAFQALPERDRSLSIQIEAELLLVPRPVCDADYLNHSCSPNAGLAGQVAVVALRDIAAGEEVCYDYAMSDTLPYDDFDCECGAPTCRRRITCEDWRRPELQARYAGFFAPHVQRLMAARK